MVSYIESSVAEFELKNRTRPQSIVCTPLAAMALGLKNEPLECGDIPVIVQDIDFDELVAKGGTRLAIMVFDNGTSLRCADLV